MNKLDFGILYVATGIQYVKEAAESARSARVAMPDVPIALWTDLPQQAPREVFWQVRDIESPAYSFIDKLRFLRHTPFKKTLYLDCDTLLLAPVMELSSLLDRFQLAYCHAPYRSCPGFPLPELPECFSEPNTGVIAYRSEKATFDALAAWERLYEKQLGLEHPPMHDQPAFRQSLYESSLNCIVLPPEYNFRTCFPAFKGANLPVKILHGREPELSAAAASVNAKKWIRVFDFRPPQKEEVARSRLSIPARIRRRLAAALALAPRR